MDIVIFLTLFKVLCVPISTAGLRRPVAGILIGLAASLILGGAFFILSFIIRVLWKIDLTLLLDSGDKVRGVGSLVVLCLVGPFTEELFFRGLCYTLIKTRTAVWFAVISSTVLFGASHLLGGGTATGVLVPLSGGVVLALLYEFTGSLFTPFALHAVANFLLFTRIL
jgi:membrane protease YdiL (CAAX protease family)